MSSFNKVIIVGTITRDIELRYTPTGSCVTDVGLAINNNYTKDGVKVEETTFVEVTVWNKSAENLSKYQGKGSSILVEGRLKTDTWDDATTGKKRSKMGVVAEKIQFLGSKKAENAEVPQFGSQQQVQTQLAQTQPSMPQNQQVSQNPPQGSFDVSDDPDVMPF